MISLPATKEVTLRILDSCVTCGRIFEQERGYDLSLWRGPAKCPEHDSKRGIRDMTIPEFLVRLAELIKTHNVTCTKGWGQQVITFSCSEVQTACALGLYQKLVYPQVTETNTDTMARDGMTSHDAWAIMAANDNRSYSAEGGTVDPQVRKLLLEAVGLPTT